MLERDFQRRITDMADRFGWQWWHIPAPMRWSPADKKWVPASSGAGLPDLILMSDHPPRLVFIEVKGDGGELSNGQTEFLQAAQKVSCECDDGRPMPDTPQAIIGVMAVWPKDEAVVEQMLRSKVVT